jgi:hypothetical protein
LLYEKNYLIKIKKRRMLPHSPLIDPDLSGQKSKTPEGAFHSLTKSKLNYEKKGM